MIAWLKLAQGYHTAPHCSDQGSGLDLQRHPCLPHPLYMDRQKTDVTIVLHLDANGVADAAHELEVRAIQLPCALAAPQEMPAAVVPAREIPLQSRRSSRRLLLVQQSDPGMFLQGQASAATLRAASS